MPEPSGGGSLQGTAARNTEHERLLAGHTGHRTSVHYAYRQHRKLGAQARAMLVAAAADRWKLRVDECRTEAGIVYGPSGQSARYGELADDASRKPVPDQVALKKPSDFRIIGKSTRRIDSPAKTNRSQRLAIDIDLPGMKTTVVAPPPVFGAKVKPFDAQTARR